MDPLAEKITELRNSFLRKLESSRQSIPDGFHPDDMARVTDSDDWLRRFLTHHDLDVNAALDMLWETCSWRKSYGTNEINESNVRMDYLEDGAMFYRNRDKEGRTLFIFDSRKHVKGQKDFEELKRCIVYWMERLERLDKGKPISLFFDMADTGISNMDMEFTKYLINLFKTYYPEFLGYIIIFEMPWILNAAFKIIKSWLPAKAVQRLKFVSKNSLKDVVAPDQALKIWGGQDDYTFRFEPELRPSKVEKFEDSQKKVRFADGSPMTETYYSNGADAPTFSSNNSALQILPSDVIVFVNEANDYIGSFQLFNEDTRILSYKIKTTSPEKYRVKPSTGVVSPKNSVKVSIVLLPESQLSTITRDKFLVMSVPVEKAEMSVQELSDLWRNASGRVVMQHRLRCQLESTPDSPKKNGPAYSTTLAGGGDQKNINLTSEVARLQDSCANLQASLKLMTRLQYITIFLVLILSIIILFLVRETQGSNKYLEEACEA